MQRLIFIAAATLFCSFVQIESRYVTPFRWLEGDWVMKTRRGTIVESWKMADEKSMKGQSKRVANGEEKVLEEISISFLDGDYYYIPVVFGQNNNEAVKFRITGFTDTSFMAENLQHDFPKRIAYTLVNIDSIHAYIDGGPEMPDKRSNFYYSRQKQ